MAVHTPLKSDHQVLGEEFCPGYSDPFGNWQTGFPCPQLDEETPGLCCGLDNLKYCCNGLGPKHIVNDVTHLPLVMGIVFGVSVAIIVSVVVCCFKCSCCLLYKKRQPANTGPLYHLHCPSSGSNGGVANMYSFSSEVTPQDTPRSSSRSQCGGGSNRWSTTTADSGPGHLGLDHHLALLEEASPTPIHGPFRSHNLSEDHHSNSGSGGRVSSTTRLSRALPDITLGLSREDEELPPPYNSNHSTLIAVRTNHGQQQATSNEVNSNNNSNSNSRIPSIINTNSHQDSHSRAPLPSSLPSSSHHNSNSLPQGFPTFLQHQNHQQRNINSRGSASLRPQIVESRHQRHSIASIGTEDTFINGFSGFPPPPSETTASMAETSCNVFSLPAPPPPSLTLQQSPDLHHNHNLHQHQYNNNNNNWPGHRAHSSSLYNQRSSSSVSSNSSSRTFAPVLSPTRRPCSTANIIQMHNPHLPPDQEIRMYTATKF